MNFKLQFVIFFFTFLLEISGRVPYFQYITKTCGGKTTYIYDCKEFNSVSEAREYYTKKLEAYYRTSTEPTTSTTTIPVPQFKLNIDNKKWNIKFLKQVNIYRKKHDAPRLKINKAIVKAAQEWADKCARENKNKIDFDETYNTLNGEFEPEEARKAIKKWYSEESQHDYKYDGLQYDSQHFSQLVWRSAKEMGCGFAKGSTKVFVVCKFGPYDKQTKNFNDNVRKPKSKS